MKFHTQILNPGNHLKLKDNDVEVAASMYQGNFSWDCALGFDGMHINGWQSQKHYSFLQSLVITLSIQESTLRQDSLETRYKQQALE